MKKIVVAGGTGFIGSRIVDKLKTMGYHIVILTREPWNFEDTEENIEYASYADAELLVDLIDGSYAVINVAGAPVVGKRWTDDYKKILKDSRVLLTRKLVTAMQKCKKKPRKFLSPSATGFYGDCGEETLTIRSKVGDDFLAKLCHNWETAAFQARIFGVQVRVMRTGIVLAKDEGALAKLAIPFKLHAGGHLGDGEQYYPWVHVDDVVGMYLFYLEEGTAEHVNVTAPYPVKMKDLAKEMANVLGGKSWLHVPAFVVKALLGESASVVLSSQNAIPGFAIKEGYHHKYITVDKALKNIYQTK